MKRKFALNLFSLLITLNLGIFIASAQTSTVTITYTGAMGLGCTNCDVCGTDWWCINNVGGCGTTSTCDSRTFTDPIPVGNVVTQITYTAYTSGSGATITPSTNGIAANTMYDPNAGNLCGNCVMAVSSGATTYPCGMPNYVYGGTNTLQLCTGVDVCVQRVVASISYAPNPAPVAPASLSVNHNNYCPGAWPTITLTASGGNGSTLYWYSGSCGGTLVGTGNPLTITAPSNTTTYYARWYSSTCGSYSGCVSITVNILPMPVAPTSATTSNNNFCGSASTITLTAIGGSGTVLHWYTGSCGGTQIGTGTPLTISAPGTTTTYYAAWSNSCGLSSCASVTVTVLPDPVAPTSATSNHTAFCAGAYPNITLTATGGSGTTLNWYSGSCGGTSIGTGTPLTIASPSTTTTYYASWTNSCGTSVCASTTVTISPNPVAPTSATVDHPIFCAGAFPTITLSSSGGSGTTLNWYAGSCGGTLVGSGTPLTITSPSTSTTYYASWTNGCGTSTCISTSVTINPAAVPPTSVSSDHPSFCVGDYTTITLTATGGNGTTLNWYSGSCGGALVGSGSPLTITAPSTTTTYYASWTNGCGPSGCASTTVTVSPTPSAPTSASVDHTNFCAGVYPLITLTASGGSGTTLNWYTGSCGGTLVGTGATCTLPSPSVSTIYYAAWSAACGTTSCVSVGVTINPQPVAPAAITADHPTFCDGVYSTITLTATGGSGTTLNWYQGSCGGTPIGTGSPITITAPSTNTTYYASWTNGCGTSACSSINVVVYPWPLKPAAAIVDHDTFCIGDYPTITLTAIGGAGSTLIWFQGSCLGTVVGTGVNLTIPAPTTNTTYYAAWSTPCDTTSCVSVSVVVYPVQTIYNVTGGGSFCAGGSGVSICLSSSTVGVNYQLMLNGNPTGNIIAGTGGQICYNNVTAAGNYTVVGTYTGSLCPGNMNGTASITVFVNPTANAGTDVTIPNGAWTTLSGSATGGSGSYSYSWSPAGLLVNANVQNPTTVNLSSTTTYTVTVTDLVTGCTGTDQVIVNISGPPLSVTTSATPSTICVGASSQLNAVAAGGSGLYTYSWSSNPAGFSSSIANPVVSPIITTTYTVTVNDGYNNSTSSVVVTVNPLPVVYSVTGGGVYCAGGVGMDICLSGSQAGVNYQLLLNGSNAGSPLPGNGTILCFGNQTAAGIYTVVATNPTTSCVNNMSGSATIAINPNPIVNAGTDVSIPNGAWTPLNGSVSGGSGSYTYSWSPAGLVTNAAIPNPNTTNLSSTTTFTLSVTDIVTGCSGTDQVTITITGPPLSTTTSANPTAVCAGGTAQLFCNSVGGSGLYTYIWSSNPPGFSSSSQNPLLIPVTTATYTVTVNDGYNTVTSSVSITVNPVPIANAGNDVSICMGSPTPLNATGGTSYSWSPSLGLSSTTVPDPTANPSTNTTYVVTVTNSFGCSATDNVTVSVMTFIPAYAGVDQFICSGHSAFLSGSGGISFNWSPPSGLNFTTIANPIATPANTTTYTLVTTDINGCTSSDAVVVTVNPNVTPNAGQDVTICSGNSTTLNATGGTIFSWSPSYGLNVTNSASPVASPQYTTTYTVTISNSSGCSGTDNVVVTVNPAATAHAGSDVTICSGNSTPLNATGGSTYLWSPNIALTDDSISNPIANPTATITYTVLVTNLSGCTATDDIMVTVNQTPNADAGTAQTICNHQTTVLTATGGAIFSWNNGVNSDINPVAPNVTTTYIVTVSNGNGCSAMDSVVITVLPYEPPVITVSGSLVFCNSTPINVTLDAGTGYSSYLWNNSLTSQVINVTTAGSYYVIGATSNGCSDTSNVVHIISPPPMTPPLIQADGPTDFCEGQHISVNLTTADPYYTYAWTSGSFTRDILVTAAGNYTVTVTDSSGCSAVSNTIQVHFFPNPVAYMNFNNIGTYATFFNSSLNDITYHWDFGDGTTSSLENPAHTYDTSGVYLVTFVVYNTCGSDTVAAYIIINSGAGIEEYDLIQNLLIYPNPTDGQLDVSFDMNGNSALEIKILNTLGQLIYKESANDLTGNYHKVFNLGNYPAGMYYLQLQTNGDVINKKIIVN